MPYNRQLYYYLSFIIIYKLNKGVMFIDTTVYYSLYIIIYKLTKDVTQIQNVCYHTIVNYFAATSSLGAYTFVSDRYRIAYNPST